MGIVRKREEILMESRNIHRILVSSQKTEVTIFHVDLYKSKNCPIVEKTKKKQIPSFRDDPEFPEYPENPTIENERLWGERVNEFRRKKEREIYESGAISRWIGSG